MKNKIVLKYKVDGFEDFKKIINETQELCNKLDNKLKQLSKANISIDCLSEYQSSPKIQRNKIA